MIPEPGTSLMISHYPIEVTKTQNNAVQMTRIMPAIIKPSDKAEQQEDTNGEA